jgi:hypothetical protein
VEQDVSDLQIQNIVLFLDKTFNGWDNKTGTLSEHIKLDKL